MNNAKETVLNDQIVAKLLQQHNDRIAELEQPVTQAKAEEYIQSLDDYELTTFMPNGVFVGKVRAAVKKGVRQGYGFVSCPASEDIFVPPSLMEGLEDDQRVAVKVGRSQKPRAERIVAFEKYYGWHAGETIAAVMQELEGKRKRELEHLMIHDPTDGWDEYKAKAKALGLTLVEISKVTRSFNYGGRGEDTYVFADTDKVDSAKAEAVLTALGGRHASTANDGPYDHGHDYIGLLTDKVGFVNRWTGPYTD